MKLITVEEMAKLIIKGTPWYIQAAMVVSLLLGMGGFLMPPQGFIDGSVLTFCAEIFGGTALITFVLNIPTYLEAGIKAKFSHGQTSITVAADEVEDSELDIEN